VYASLTRLTAPKARLVLRGSDFQSRTGAGLSRRMAVNGASGLLAARVSFTRQGPANAVLNSPGGPVIAQSARFRPGGIARRRRSSSAEAGPGERA
jgi:hypothetical protein